MDPNEFDEIPNTDEFDLDGFHTLGNVLVRTGAITEQQLQTVVLEQGRSGGRIGEIACRLGFCSPTQRDAALEAQRQARMDLDTASSADVMERALRSLGMMK